jgi:pimeloyl-ACP methyl ester carboxylesterase
VPAPSLSAMTTMRLADDRVYCFAQWGDPAGVPLFWLHGTPGGRLTRVPDPDLWSRLGFRVVTVDRPGYGNSSPLPGRTVAHIAADAAALADHLSLDTFAVVGSSGGGPHALAVAALLPDRVRACAPVCSAAPADPADLNSMIDVNRAAFKIVAERGRAGLAEYLAAQRDELLADMAAVVQAMVADASGPDREWLSRPGVQADLVESWTDALRPGVDGLLDDEMSLLHQPWGFDPGAIRCPVHFWHSDDDALAPLAPVQRLAARIPGARLTTWHGQGHAGGDRNAEQVLTDLRALAG